MERKEYYEVKKNMILESIQYLDKILETITFKLLVYFMESINVTEYVSLHPKFIDHYFKISDNSLNKDIIERLNCAIDFVQVVRNNGSASQIVENATKLATNINRTKNKNNSKIIQNMNNIFYYEKFKRLSNTNAELRYLEKISKLEQREKELIEFFEKLYSDLETIETILIKVKEYAQKNECLDDYFQFVSLKDVAFVSLFIDALKYTKDPTNKEALNNLEFYIEGCTLFSKENKKDQNIIKKKTSEN